MNKKYYMFIFNFLLHPIICMQTFNSPTDQREINIQQLTVKNQFDVDGGGTYSCGYHALKNGILILESLLESNNISSETEEYLKSTEAVNDFFGPQGEWRKAVATYKHKQLAKDYIYNYLIYSMTGDIEHIYLKNKQDANNQSIYSLHLNCGYIKFKSINNLDFEKHLYLKDTLIEAANILINNFELEESNAHIEIDYHFNRNQIFEAIKTTLENATSKYKFTESEIKNYFTSINNIKFTLNKGTIKNYIEATPPYLEYNPQSNIEFTDNLEAIEIENIIRKFNLNELPVCIIGDKGVSIKEEYNANYNNCLKQLANDIHNNKQTLAIFLINEDNHWFACVIQSNDTHINYYLTNSSANSSINENSVHFQYLRTIIEQKTLSQLNASNEKPKIKKEISVDNLAKIYKNANSSGFNDSVDKDKELILSNLTSPYAEDSIESLPSLDLLTNSRTASLINQVTSILKGEHPELRDKIKAGLILYGPPGTGKTVLTEIICREANLKTFFIGGGDLRTKYQASTQSILRDIIKQAGEYPDPSAIIIDEFEAIASSPKNQDNSEDTMSLAFFKTCSQDLKKCKNKPYLFCTTNYVGKIDAAIERRFLSLLINLPEKERLAKIMKFYLLQNKKEKFIKENISENFIDLLAGYKFKEKFSCENVKALIDTAIMEEVFKNPIIHELPWRYTKGFWDGTEFEKRLYNAYCNFIERRNNQKKEREKEKNKSNHSTPVLETAKNAGVQGGVMSLFAISGYFAKKQWEKLEEEAKKNPERLKNMVKAAGGASVQIAKAFLPTMPS